MLTIHSAKGLEFKVVVVADAGRDYGRTDPDEILCLPDGRLGFRVAHPSSGKRLSTAEYEEVKEAEQHAEEAERLRLYYVAMTRAIDRLIVSGAVGEGGADARTPIGWVLQRLELSELEEAGTVEIEREGARLLLRVDRHAEEPVVVLPPATEEQLELFEVSVNGGAAAEAPTLAPLADVPEPPLHRVRRLSYSALSLFEQCSYRYFAERVVGLRPREAGGSVPGREGLAATELGDGVHALLERVDLRAPAMPEDLDELVRARYPAVMEDELARIRGFVEEYCTSELAGRLATLEGAAPERPFAFEHDGVLLHGRLDMLWLDGSRALVVDYKTNALAELELEPAEVVERDYHLQRLVYALACFRCGVEEVEVVYQFLERPNDLVTRTYRRKQAPELEAELSAAIAKINANEFRPTPSEFTCSDCPALDVVCAGPRLRNH